MKKRFITKLLAMCLVGAMILAACNNGGTDTAPAADSGVAADTEVGEGTDVEANDEADDEADTDAGNDNGQEAPAATGEQIELRFTWWGGDERARRTEEVIDLFMAENPDIRIVGEPRPGDAYWDVLAVQLEGGGAPDIMQFGGNYPDYIMFLLPLQGFIGNELQIGSEAQFDQQVLETGTLDGNLYGISLGTNVLSLAYNRTMLEEAGAPMPSDNMTWDEFIEYGRVLRDLLPDNVFPFVDNSVNQANYISYFMLQRGEPIWTAELESHVTVEGTYAWINLWEDMREEGLIPDIDTTASFQEVSPDTSALVHGRAAIGLIWSNQLGAYQDSMTDELGLMQLPTGDQDALAIQVSQYLSINATTEHPEAAARFINFFVTNSEAGAILGTDRGIPSSPTVRAEIAPQANEIDAILYEYLSVAAARAVPQGPNLPNDAEFVDTLRIIGQSVAFGQMTRAEGAQDIYDLVYRLMTR